MNVRRVILISLATISVASCSEKSQSDRHQNAQGNPTKQEVATANSKRAGESAAERSSKSEAELSEAKGENEGAPAQEEIAEDCVAFLRSTKTIPRNSLMGDCPQCPVSTEGSEVLRFDDIRVDRVAPTESTCEVDVTIRATFNPSTRETISGGLTGWISPEQRAQYLQGKTPSDQQTYQVKVIYKRKANGWRAVEFDRF